jgi:hypothetical protein
LHVYIAKFKKVTQKQLEFDLKNIINNLKWIVIMETVKKFLPSCVGYHGWNWYHHCSGLELAGPNPLLLVLSGRIVWMCSTTTSPLVTFPTCSPIGGTRVLLSLSTLLLLWNRSPRLRTCNSLSCINADTWPLSRLGLHDRPNKGNCWPHVGGPINTPLHWGVRYVILTL